MEDISKQNTFEEYIFPTARKNLLYGNIICAIIFILLAFADPPQYRVQFFSFRLIIVVFLSINTLLLCSKSIKQFGLPFETLSVFSIFLFNCPIVILAFKSNLQVSYIVGYYVAVLSSLFIVTVTHRILNASFVSLFITISAIIVYFFESINTENIRIIIHFYTMMIIAYIFGRLFNVSRVKEYNSIITINNHLERVKESEKQLLKEVAVRKETEQELRKFQKELKAKNKDILEFTNMVTHDLKKPLTCFVLFLDVLNNEKIFNSSDDIKEFLNLAKQSTQYMNDLLENLLDFAKWDAGSKKLKKEIVDINNLVIAVSQQLKILADEKSIAITSNIDAQLSADESALKNIFMNLIGNAIHYIGNKPDPKIDIRSSFDNEKKEYTFCIKDTGIGIPKESQRIIFDTFKRGSNISDQSGTGLGLPIVKKIIEAHNGNIWFNSTEGEGTEFYFSLPK